MFEKLRALLAKYHNIISYLIFGVLTTVVDFIIYYPLYNAFGLPATVSTAIAWVGAVIFAFVTNKPFVFKSDDWSPAVVRPELVKFIGTRIGSGLLQTAVLFVLVDLLGWDGNLMKIATSVLVVIINYIGSKLVVFRK